MDHMRDGEAKKKWHENSSTRDPGTPRFSEITRLRDVKQRPHKLWINALRAINLALKQTQPNDSTYDRQVGETLQSVSGDMQ